ncbi:hypothetical protein P5V15_009097 [Pogonomyrmex californicus]
MSVLVRKFHHLRGVYLSLRLGCDNGSYSHRVVFGASSRCEHNTPSTAWIKSERSQNYTTPAATVVTNEVDYVDANFDTDVDRPERISENKYAHSLFLNSMKYKNTVLRPSTTYAEVSNEEALALLEMNWPLMTGTEIVSAVKKLSYNICHNKKKIEPFKYADAFNALNLKSLTNDELMAMMRHLVPFSNHLETCDFYNNFCVRVDRECMIRFPKLSIENTLLLCDIIYQITPKNSYGLYNYQYVWHSIRKLGNKPHKLHPQQLVQILFFLNIYRKPPINMYELEYELEQCMNELSINELAVASLGFFKTSTKIRSRDFLNNIIKRTIAEIDMVNAVSIAAIVKLVRYSMQLTEVKSLQNLLKALTPYEPRYTLMSLAHIMQAAGRVALYDRELTERVIRRLNKEVKTARLKDFERLLFTFSILNIDSSNSVYQNVIEDLRATWDTSRAKEIAKFPYVVSRIFGYLSIQNIYPIDLIKRVMAPEFVIKTCRGNYHYISREYCVLDYSLQIEVPEYDGPFLKPNIRDFLQKKYYDFHLETSTESTRTNVLFTTVLATCQELFNTTSDILQIRPLPHYTPQDIVFCLDEQNQLVPSEKFFSQFEVNAIKRVDKENSNNRWIALVMAAHGQLIRNCQKTNYQIPTGALAAKLRQLSIIGYTPIMIPYFMWNDKSPQERCNYIKELVFRKNIASESSNR